MRVFTVSNYFEVQNPLKATYVVKQSFIVMGPSHTGKFSILQCVW